VVASFGNVAITQSDLEREYCFERFLDGQWPAPPPDAATLERVRERLTFQKLLVVEESANPLEPAELEKSASEPLNKLRQRFSREEDFQAALRSLDMDEPGLIQHLAEQQRILRMIDQRLRPAATPTPGEVETYYRETFVPEYVRRTDAATPALAEVEGQIREILVQKKIDQLLVTWLEELKSSRRVKFHSF
jgi:hypothetical protein